MLYTPVKITDKNTIKQMSQLASEIVKEHYDPILGNEQNDYMIQRFQSVTAIENQLNDGYNYYFVCNEQKKNKVGFLAFYKKENELYLSKFYLKKGCRGKGYSKDMLKFLITIAKEWKVPAIVLNVNKYNPSIDVYERLGFQRIREETIDIGDGYYMDDYVYQYVIG